MQVKLAEVKQACGIHGGLLPMMGASVAVRLSRISIPRRWRRRAFSAMYGSKYEPLDESQLEKPLIDFRSLNELFTRGVPTSLRPMPDDKSLWISPCDCTVQSTGTLDSGTKLTAKGVDYSLQSLCPNVDTSAFDNGRYAILFLSPRDCHRVLSPTDATLTAVTHVPGYRLLVHPSHQTAEFPVFSLNERIVMELDSELGKCLLIMVAGWGVGHITHPFPANYKGHSRRITRHEFTPAQGLSRGEWMATFELGSTVILICERTAEQVEQNAEPLIAVDQKLQYGQPMFRGTSPCR